MNLNALTTVKQIMLLLVHAVRIHTTGKQILSALTGSMLLGLTKEGLLRFKIDPQTKKSGQPVSKNGLPHVTCISIKAYFAVNLSRIEIKEYNNLVLSRSTSYSLCLVTWPVVHFTIK